MREWGTINSRVRGARRFGSVALELAYIAAGRLDGLWEQSLNSWDIMAGIILVREAGGRVTDFSDQESLTLYQHGQVLATNQRIHAELRDALNEVRTAKR